MAEQAAKEPVKRRRIGRPPDSDGAVTRRAIIDAAARRFAMDGYARTTHRAIALETDLTAGAVYHYFPSKASLYAAVAEEAVTSVLARFRRAVADATTLPEQLQAVISASLKLSEDEPQFKAFMVEAGIEGLRNVELLEPVHGFAIQMRAFIDELVQGAFDRGEIAEGVEAREVTFMALALTTGLSHFGMVSPPRAYTTAVRGMSRLLDGSMWKVPPG